MRRAVRLRYLWESQTVIAIGPLGEVLAAHPVAELILSSPRRGDALPPEGFGFELDAIREQVVARAHLKGQPAPRGWARRLHGKAIETCGAR